MVCRRVCWQVRLLLLAAVLCEGIARAQSLPRFDFTKGQTAAEWRPTHDVARLYGTPEGMVIEIGGGDPYLHGPARDYPPGQLLWLRIRLKSDQAGAGQVFYFTATKGTNEADSVHFPVRGGGAWEEIRIPMPALGPGTYLRLDPPGTGGICVVASIVFEPRTLLKEPAWPRPSAPEFKDEAPSVQIGGLLFHYRPDTLGGFELRVAGERMAVGHTRPLIGYLQDGQVRWLDLAPHAKVTAEQKKGVVQFTAVARDADGADWEVRQRFSAAEKPDRFDVETQVTVNRDRAVVYLPMLTLLPGVGSFGTAKNQALFAGLEYLDSPPTEVSSSEADIIGPGSHRQVPDTLRIAFPLMAVQANDRYIGLIWEKAPTFSALFDSPDRIFKAGGHLMGVIFPGSDGSNRVEGNLLPYEGVTIQAGKPLVLHATLIGGKGTSIIPAVQQYVALKGLPPVPNPGMDVQQYVQWAAGGWLNSKIRDGDTYRHAYWPGISGFAPGPAADAPVFMEWLACQTKDTTLAGRLRAAAREAIAKVAPSKYNRAGVSHVRYPVPALLYGHVAENAQRAQESARLLWSGFAPDGSVPFQKSPNGLDYGKTHFAPDANGLTGQVVLSLLTDATVCGDPELVQEGLRLLRALDKFAHTAPRGAQTWEVPLHTPDILASAYLVRAYTLGYELTGERHFLDQALAWAWTGVPFTYLVNPTPQTVGLYATTPVFGATQWVAPNWMGLPVQWCGLVYADALYRLIRHDSTGPWKRIADGITASGIQQSFDAKDPDLQGLLPDSFNMRPQTRNPVAINPGTVQANAIRLFGGPEIYDFRAFRAAGVLVHAPGAITDVQEEAGRVSFKVQGWLDRPYYVLAVGLKKAPRVRINGRAAPHPYREAEGRLILQVKGSPTIEIVTK